MNGKAGSYRDLIVWQQSMDLAVAVYAETRSWPKEELYGLTGQVRRSATSIPSNIAEGYGREVRGSYLQFLRIAQGSLKELETQLLIAQRIGVSKPQAIEPLLGASSDVGRLLRGLLRKLSSA